MSQIENKELLDNKDTDQNINPPLPNDKLEKPAAVPEVNDIKEKGEEEKAKNEGEMLRERIEASEQKSPKGAHKSPINQRHRKTNISPEEQKALNHVRVDFQKALAKLGENTTKEIVYNIYIYIYI